MIGFHESMGFQWALSEATLPIVSNRMGSPSDGSRHWASRLSPLTD